MVELLFVRSIIRNVFDLRHFEIMAFEFNVANIRA